ncbi:MAG: FtsX-like permease family protein [Opitutaceae bacterium]|nr:FtsX-like permease family protein [Opitutaceae bacterium]MBP9911769.1 FtsX-like permease family protein [Opitutaceae bacterium]
MSHLDLKLIRDLRALKSQAFAVALVMACGLAMMIMTRSLILSLETTRDDYYREHRFAQVFSRLKRAPQSVAGQLAAIPGVAAVQTGIALQATLDLPGMDEPATGLILSLPERGELQLNRLYLRRGRLLVGRAPAGEILAGEAFAEANHLQPGSEISAVLYGRRQSFRIAGIVLSPEFVFEAPPGAALPNNKTYGVFWMPYKELATASNLDGAFNNVALTLAPGFAEGSVIAAVDRILEPYGGRGAYGRASHPSHTRLRDEINVLRGLSIGFPLVFLSVAAFMTNAVMSRQITLQREQIAMLKACGFSNRQLGWHYLKFALAIVLVGTGLGALGGIALGHRLVVMYHLFFRFPLLEFQLAQDVLVTAVFVCALAAITGVWGAVRQAVRLPPAEAMRPEPPANFRPALIERLRLGRAFTASFRMALRNIERRPARALLTSVALALATGILVVPSSFRDGINYVLDFQWDLIQRQTVAVSLIEPGPARAIADFRALPGVIAAEPLRSAPVELSAGNQHRRLGLFGLPARGSLNRVIGADGRQLTLPAHGIVLSAKLAEVLQIRPGELLHLRVLDGKRPELTVPVAALSEDFAGTAAFMEIGALNHLLGEGDRINGAYLTVAAGRWHEFLRATKQTPRIGNVVIKAAIREGFRTTTAESIGLIQKIYLAFATVVAFGIVYNSARISLSERQRELATLRVIGFTRGEVGAVLIGELVLLTLVALPFGLLIGSGLAHVILQSVNTEFVRLPLILTPANYAFAVLVVSVASLLSAILACRRLNQLDLVGVLKARD